MSNVLNQTERVDDFYDTYSLYSFHRFANTVKYKITQIVRQTKDLFYFKIYHFLQTTQCSRLYE